MGSVLRRAIITLNILRPSLSVFRVGGPINYLVGIIGYFIYCLIDKIFRII